MRRYSSGVQVWLRRLSNGDHALMVYNPGASAFMATIRLRALGLRQRRYAVRDLWSHRTRDRRSSIAVSLPPTAAALYRVRADRPPKLRRG